MTRYEKYRDTFLRAARKYGGTPKGLYATQRRRALTRGISWEFTLEEWIRWWGGDLAKRGRGPDELCMARRGDTGPYSVANVVKLTNKENREQYYLRRWGPASRRRGVWASDTREIV